MVKNNERESHDGRKVGQFGHCPTYFRLSTLVRQSAEFVEKRRKTSKNKSEIAICGKTG
jgi:hypothetical protein